ncbi:hypothetical protein Tco_1333019 [Tanacetum coccineum]
MNTSIFDSLREVEAASVVAFNEATILLERFLKQKAKIDWLKEGDSNSAYFHKTVRSRTSRSRIDVIMNNEGTVFKNDHVADVFVSHYVNFLGEAGHTSGFDGEDLFQSRLADQDALNMVRPISRQEVKDSMFAMGYDKSLGPDGYSDAFFKKAWHVVEKDVIDAVSEIFSQW